MNYKLNNNEEIDNEMLINSKTEFIFMKDKNKIMIILKIKNDNDKKFIIFFLN